jgi:hypothetical protein
MVPAGKTHLGVLTGMDFHQNVPSGSIGKLVFGDTEKASPES